MPPGIARMTDFTVMTEAEFEGFMEISMRDHSRSQVRAGNWTPQDADGNIRMLRARFLPDGMATPGHRFLAIRDTTTGAQVGGLWYVVDGSDGARKVFVVDIQIFPGYRRRGHGERAFRLMEADAKAMGASAISLHVFRDNAPARAMYGKLGFEGAGDELTKTL